MQCCQSSHTFPVLVSEVADNCRSRSTSAVKATPAMPTIRAASASARLVAAALPQLDAVSKVYLGWSMSLCRCRWVYGAVSMLYTLHAHIRAAALLVVQTPVT